MDRWVSMSCQMNQVRRGQSVTCLIGTSGDQLDGGLRSTQILIRGKYKAHLYDHAGSVYGMMPRAAELIDLR